MAHLGAKSGIGGTVGGRCLKAFMRSPSCHEILPRLYLGDYATATNKDEMTRLGITDMITAEIKPLQASDLAPCVKRYLYINVMDHPKQDLLSHFETSNEFIENALRTPTNKVYVHCVAGISRSASLVIAYIMKTRTMQYNDAYELVSQKRHFVDPNEGFVRQLTLYHKMRYSIDIGNIEYRRMVLDALVFEFRLISLSYYQVDSSKATTTGQSGTSSASAQRSNLIYIPMRGHWTVANKDNVGLLFDQYYNKLHLQQVSQYPHIYDSKTAYKCNKCRAIVFYAISMIENTFNNDTQTSSATTSSQQGKITTCPFIFIEPQPWMSRNVLERDGDLECYKCKRKLGKFDWTSKESFSCSCELHNSHMNYNLFKIMRKKIDCARN